MSFNINYIHNLTILISLIIYCNCVEEGTECITKDLDIGVCKLMKNCIQAINNLSLGIYPTTCGFQGEDVVVCCTQPGEIAKKKCRDYFNDLPVSVVGGSDVKENEFPHMAALGFGNSTNIQWQCGGTLISYRHILTAAHCLKSPLGEVKYAKLGIIRFDGTTGIQLNIVKRIQHPLYSPPSVYHDIAILELEKSLRSEYSTRPACLNTKNEVTGSYPLTAAGWGLTQFGGSQSHTLQKVELELFTHEECNKTYKTNRRYTNGIQYDNQICAGSKTHNYDTCQGDSGGPLHYYDLSLFMYNLVGITSFGKACGTINIPGIYTRVSNYVPWIEKTIWKQLL